MQGIAVKIRKIKYRSHKCFGIHSRIVDGVGVTPSDASGRSVGSKQVLPGEYPADTRVGRTKAERQDSPEQLTVPRL